MCIFKSATVKIDCPLQENYELFKDLIQTVTSFTVVLEILKKSSENDQLTGHFQSFPQPLDPKSEKKIPVCLGLYGRQLVFEILKHPQSTKYF